MRIKETHGFFKDLHDEIQKTITPEVVEQFANLGTNAERIRFTNDLPVLEKLDLKKFLDTSSDKPQFPVVKSADLARSLKAEGNGAVQKGDWMKALEFYSKSYINMPRNLREDLSIVLANRSAALYHLSQYELCLDDIIRAIAFDYPRHLRHKIMERKARCLLALNRNAEAADAFKGTIHSLDAADLPVERKQKLQKDAQIMISVLTKGAILAAPETPKSDPIIKKPPRPKLPGKTNKNYPALSESVVIQRDGDRGRFAVASKDLTAGEIVLVEKPFAKVLLSDYSKTHCQHCITRTPVPIACPKCPNVIFCSDKCLKEATASYHGYECQILPLLSQSGCSVTCQLSLRIITQKNLAFFEKFHGEPVEEPEVYKSDDINALFTLVGHQDTRTHTDLLQRTELVIFLLKLLDLVGFFSGKPRESPIKEEELKSMKVPQGVMAEYIGELILKCSQLSQFNAHEVFELQCPKPFVGKNVLKHTGKSVFIGGAILNTLSLFNHSCDPGVARYFNGDTIVVRAAKNIKQGEEVSENYGPIFTNVPKNERQTTLKSQYWFDCRCKACEENWPLYSEMTENYMRFKCDSDRPCRNVIPVPHDSNEMMIKCGLCGQYTNILKGLKALQNTDTIIKQGRDLEESGKYGEAMKKFVEVLKLYDSTLAPPYKSYYDCAQNLRDCMLALGNYCIIE